MAEVFMDIIAPKGVLEAIPGPSAPLPGGKGRTYILTNIHEVIKDLKIIQGAITLNWKDIMQDACNDILVPKAKVRLRHMISSYNSKFASKSSVSTNTGLISTIKAIVKSAQLTNVNILFGSDAHYGMMFEKGTGIYGPKRKYITPIKSKVLAWQDASGQWYFARKVSGMPPRPFLVPTVHAEWTNVLLYISARVKLLLTHRRFNTALPIHMR